MTEVWGEKGRGSNVEGEYGVRSGRMEGVRE